MKNTITQKLTSKKMISLLLTVLMLLTMLPAGAILAAGVYGEGDIPIPDQYLDFYTVTSKNHDTLTCDEHDFNDVQPPFPLEPGRIWVGKDVRLIDRATGTFEITLKAWGARYTHVENGVSTPNSMPLGPLIDSTITVTDLVDDNFICVNVPNGLTYNPVANTVAWTVKQGAFIDDIPTWVKFTVRLKEGWVVDEPYYTNKGASATFKPFKGNPYYWTLQVPKPVYYTVDGIKWNNGNGGRLQDLHLVDNDLLIGGLPFQLEFEHNNFADGDTFNYVYMGVTYPVKVNITTYSPYLEGIYTHKFTLSVSNLPQAGATTVYEFYSSYSPGGNTLGENAKYLKYIIYTDFQQKGVYWVSADTWTEPVPGRGMIMYSFDLRDVQGTKVWVDNNNAYDTRPDTLVINLLRNDNMSVPYRTMTLAKSDPQYGNSNIWSFEFTDLPVKSVRGTPYFYTVAEGVPAGYAMTRNGTTITNTLSPGETTLSMTKVWLDDSNADNTRPDDVTFTITRDGDFFRTETFSGAGDSWDHIVTQLPRFSATDQHQFVYEVYEAEEDIPSGYAMSQAEGSNTITNTLQPGSTRLWMAKRWLDNGNADNTRPANITFTITQDGDFLRTETFSGSRNTWYHRITLPKYSSEDQHLFAYSVYEATANIPEGYGMSQEQGSNIITNTLLPGATEITLTKHWVDDDNANGTRGAGTITLTRYEGAGDNVGTAVGAMTLNLDQDQTQTFNVPVYSDVSQIKYIYRASETTVPDGYGASYSADTFTVTNTLGAGMADITVVKHWVDSGNADDTRGAGAIELWQYEGEADADGALIGSFNLDLTQDQTVVFEDQPVYSDNQIKYIYKAVETVVPIGYSDSYSESEDGLTLTVTNTLQAGQVILTVEKEWIDGGNADNTRPASVTYTVTGRAGGEVVDGPRTVTGNAASWGFSLSVPKYDEQQRLIAYTVEETQVPGYDEPLVTGSAYSFTVTNPILSDTISITGEKVWEGDEGYSNRPQSVIVALLQDGEPIDSFIVGGPEWSFSFDNLPLRDESGRRYVYDISEAPVPGYTTSITSLQGGRVYRIVNTRVTGSAEGILKVYKVLFDKNGIPVGDIIDHKIETEEDQALYDAHRNPFNLRLTDNTEEGADAIVTLKDVYNGEAEGDIAEFIVSDWIMASADPDSLVLEEINLSDVYEFVEILPITWIDGVGVTTVFNRIKGTPDLETNDLRVVKYVVDKGRAVSSPTINSRIFGVTVSPVDASATGTIIIDAVSVADAIVGVYGGFEEGFNPGVITAVLSSGDLSADRVEGVNQDGKIVFGGLSMNTEYTLEILTTLADEAIMPGEIIIFTDKVTCLVSVGLVDIGTPPVAPDPEPVAFEQGAAIYGYAENGEPIYEPIIIGYEQGAPIYGEPIDEEDDGTPIYGDPIDYEQGAAIYGYAENGEPIVDPESELLIVGYEQIPIYGYGPEGEPIYEPLTDGGDGGGPQFVMETEYRNNIGFGVGISGDVKANDPRGLLFSGLASGLYLVEETKIPTNYSFYGMKLSESDIEMGEANGLAVNVTGETGSLVIIFNQYGYTPPPPDFEPDPDPEKPTPDPDPDTPIVIIPDNPIPLDKLPDAVIPEEKIVPDEVPLGNLPKTNAGGINGLGVISFGIAGIIGLLGVKKKKED